MKQINIDGVMVNDPRMTEEEIELEMPNCYTVPKYLSLERLTICGVCDRFIKTLKVCRECTCFMPFKTRMDYVDCPLGKW